MLSKIGKLLRHTYTLVGTVVLMTCVLAWQSYEAFGPGEDAENQHYKIVCSDGSGYYAYLPAVFIYQDPGLSFLDRVQAKYPGAKFDEMVQPNASGKRLDKYFVGTAVCMTPAFLVAHLCATVSGGDADGYASIYLFSVCFSALAFWLLGIVSLVLLLKNYQVQNSFILFGLLALTFGTNLNYYTIYEPSISHVYSFGLISFLLLQLQGFALVPHNKYLLRIFIALGLIAIIRPTNFLIVLMVPFFFGSLKNFGKQLVWIVREKWALLLVSFALFLGIIFLQYLNVHAQYGFWGFNAYSVEKFDYLANPKIPEVLWGYRKGFFVYTPFMLLLFPALFFLYRRSRYFFLGFMLFTAVFIYLMASWWCWYYGGSLGMRPLVDIYALLILPIVLMFSALKMVGRTLLLLFMAATIWFNLLLSYQFNHAIVRYDEMNKDRYWQVFVQTGRRFEWVFYLENPVFKPGKYKTLSRLKNVSAELSTGGRLYFKYQPVAQDSLSVGRIALRVQGIGEISDPDNIPKVMLLVYRNGKPESGGMYFFGPQLRRLNRKYPLNIEILSPQKYAGCDSLEVIFENGEGPASFQNLSCTFYQFTPVRP
jgi:hypothetical protein